MLFWLLACQFALEETPPLRPNSAANAPLVALVTIDTWRFDHFGADLTPNLWAMAAEGERFERAYSPMGLTTPAHATMLTGMPPWEHGMEANNHHGYTLKPEVKVLPEMFDGWASAAFVSAYPAGPEGGMRRGWDVFDGPESGERAGSIAVSRAIEWIPNDKPALLWVHVYEPHGPYEGEGGDERTRYGEEVHRVDEMLAPLLTKLRDRGATIVVTSDHGEVLDEERCSYQHERSISDHVLRVPMFRWSPEIKSTVNKAWVGLSDVPALLRGESPSSRSHWIAQSGMCEGDCAPGCSPVGIEGRDTVVADDQGRWINRPGRGVFRVGTPAESLRKPLLDVPSVKPPSSTATDHARSLGYISP